jgi:phosphotransferase system enzyme I (PtsI)
MISAFFEVLEIKRLLREVMDALDKEGIEYRGDIKIGIMIEVPSVVFMADAMAKEVDFFSIGTNDLIQYALAIDRGNREVAHLFQALDPAIIRMIKHVTDVSKDCGIKTFMCGEMAANPLHIPLLLGMGLEGLSMNPQAIPAAKQIIRSLNIEDAKTLVENVLCKTTATSVFKILHDAYGNLINDRDDV